MDKFGFTGSVHTLLEKFGNVQNMLFYKGNVKFDDIYDVFEQRYLKIAKNVLNFLKCDFRFSIWF